MFVLVIGYERSHLHTHRPLTSTTAPLIGLVNLPTPLGTIFLLPNAGAVALVMAENKAERSNRPETEQQEQPLEDRYHLFTLSMVQMDHHGSQPSFSQKK